MEVKEFGFAQATAEACCLFTCALCSSGLPDHLFQRVLDTVQDENTTLKNYLLDNEEY